MTIEERQQEVIEEFEGFDDWMDKYQYLIDLGSDQQPLPSEYKTESNLIDGCQSRVWREAAHTPHGPRPAGGALAREEAAAAQHGVRVVQGDHALREVEQVAVDLARLVHDGRQRQLHLAATAAHRDLAAVGLRQRLEAAVSVAEALEGVAHRRIVRGG